MKKLNALTSRVPVRGTKNLLALLAYKLAAQKHTANFVAMLLAALLITALTGCEEEDATPIPVVPVVAKAGPDQTVQAGQTVTLDASASKDSQNKALSFSWVITTKPNGSTATLTNPTQATPTFIADLAGEYELEVRVSSSNGQSKDKVKVTATAPSSDPNAATILNEDILSDLVLQDKFSEPGKADYIVTSQIQVKAKLTVAPGVVIEFDANKGLDVTGQGQLIADGTASQTITFTGKQKTKGFWKGIFIGSYGEMDHVEVAYAGSRDANEPQTNTTANVMVYGYASWTSASLKVSNSVFSNGGGYGLYVGVGADILDFTNITFRTNTSSGLYLNAEIVQRLKDDTKLVGGNGHEGVTIGGTVPYYTHSEEVIWPALAEGATYMANDHIFIESGVKLEPGVTIEFAADKGLYVRSGSGYLTAKGTADKPITFTGKTKRNGYWKGIMIYSSSNQNEFDFVQVSYGGSSHFDDLTEGVKTNIGVYSKVDALSGYASPSLRLTNSSSSNSGGYGLYMDKGSSYLAAFAKNKFEANTGAALYIQASQVYRLDNETRYHSSNGFRGIETEGTVAHGEEVEWPTAPGGMGIHVVGDLFFMSGVKILSKPGAPIALLFDSNKVLWVQNDGYLIAKGSAESAVSFRGFVTPQYTSNWQGIRFDSKSPLNELNKVSVSNGGMSNYPMLIPMANVTIRETAKIINCDIFDSIGYGVYVGRLANINADASTVNRYTNNSLGNYFKEQ